MKNITQQSGFSLIELTLAMALAGVVMGVGVPSYQSMTDANYTAATTMELKSALRIARHAAVEHNVNAKVCAIAPSNDAAAVPACDTSGSKSWANGWLVQKQIKATGVYENIAVQPQSDLSTSIGVTNSTTNLDEFEITFGPTGTLKGMPGASIVVASNSCTKSIEVAMTGFARRALNDC